MMIYRYGGYSSFTRSILDKFIPKDFFATSWPEVKLHNFMEA